MIEYNLIAKIFAAKGLLWHALRARNTELNARQLTDMIAQSSVRMTPHLGRLLQANIEIHLSHLSHGYIFHYIFVYSGKNAELISASTMNANGQWYDATITQEKKAG